MHGVERVIAELEFQLGRLGFIEFVGFGDDDFFVRPASELEQFAASYKSRIRLPFGIAVSARTYRREKLDILLGAGLKIVQMGVQSGSQRVLDTVFNRTLSVERTRGAGLDLARAMRTGMDLSLDFIIDNPYETREDAYKTFRYILELPPKVQLNVFSLAYFPGTPLYERALADGIISPTSREIYRFWARTSLRYQRNWETVLILLTRFLRLATKGRSSAVEGFLRCAGSRPVRVFMSILPGAFFSALAWAIQGIVLAQAHKKERAHLGSGVEENDRCLSSAPIERSAEATDGRASHAGSPPAASRLELCPVHLEADPPAPQDRGLAARTEADVLFRDVRREEERVVGALEVQRRGKQAGSDPAQRGEDPRLADHAAQLVGQPVRAAASSAMASSRVSPPFFDSRRLSEW